MSSTRSARRAFDPSACLSVYDGQGLAGFIEARGQHFHAFNVAGEPLGVFSDLRFAVRAAPRPQFPEIPSTSSDPSRERPIQRNDRSHPVANATEGR